MYDSIMILVRVRGIGAKKSPGAGTVPSWFRFRKHPNIRKGR